MHTRHSLPHTQIIVIRPLIFPSLPSSLGMTSNRATLTSQGSCSSHTGFNINWFFFFSCCFAHKDSPTDFWVESGEQCIAFSVRAPLQLHRPAACNPILHLVLLCWGDSTLLLPSLAPCLVSFFSPPCCQTGSISPNQNSCLITSPLLLQLWLILVLVSWLLPPHYLLKRSNYKNIHKRHFPLPQPGFKMT